MNKFAYLSSLISKLFCALLISELHSIYMAHLCSHYSIAKVYSCTVVIKCTIASTAMRAAGCSDRHLSAAKVQRIL